MNKKIERISTIDVDQIFPHAQCVLIICKSTEIYYTAQTGGNCCDHPVAEGFAIPLNFSSDYDDCKHNCWLSHDNEEDKTEEDKKRRHESALEINKLLKEYSGCKENNIKNIEFDFDRINEFTEGWWPVIFYRLIKIITISRWIFNAGEDAEYIYERNKGYLFCGNCD